MLMPLYIQTKAYKSWYAMVKYDDDHGSDTIKDIIEKCYWKTTILYYCEPFGGYYSSVTSYQSSRVIRSLN